MANGWIKIHSSFLDWDWFYKPEMVQMFLYLLLNASSSDTVRNGVRINRGQLIRGWQQISESTGLSRQVIRTCLSRFESDGIITRKTIRSSTNQGTLITVSNYDNYMFVEDNVQPTFNQPPTNLQPTTVENVNQPLTNPKEDVIPYYTNSYSDKEGVGGFVVNQPLTNPKVKMQPTPPYNQENEENKESNIKKIKEEKEKEKEKITLSIDNLNKKEKSELFPSEEILSSVEDNQGSTPPCSPPKLTKEQIRKRQDKKKDEFYKSLIPYVQTYGKETVRNFFDYWTEPNKSGTKWRYELEPTWDTSRRLGTWAKNEGKYNRNNNVSNGTDRTDIKAARQQRAEDVAAIIARLAAEDDARQQVRQS